MQNELSLPLHSQTELPMKVFLDTTRTTLCDGDRIDGKIIPYPIVEGFAEPGVQWLLIVLVFVILVYVAIICAFGRHKTPVTQAPAPASSP
jgi:hypothetical protein